MATMDALALRTGIDSSTVCSLMVTLLLRMDTPGEFHIASLALRGLHTHTPSHTVSAICTYLVDVDAAFHKPSGTS